MSTGPIPRPGGNHIPSHGVMNPANGQSRQLSAREQQILQDIELYRQTPVLRQTIIPPLSYPTPPGAPAPHFTAIHQSHLRSPLLVPKVGFPKDLPLDHPDRRFYQVVKEFALAPVKLQPVPITDFHFSIPTDEFNLLAKRLNASGKSPDLRGFVPGSLQYRLRCIERKNPGNDCPLNEWVLQDTLWPENVNFHLEAGGTKHVIELRRKKQHGKDLPVDLTDIVAMYPANSDILVVMSMPGRRQVFREKNIFFAVEIIEILGHENIMNLCQIRRRTIQETVESIKRSLSVIVEDDDDEISLVSSELTLDITDPFSARIFTIPVRSDGCLHRECFDLETFLLSRISKPNRKGQPVMIDVWKCPLCKVDARPQTLYVDEYLLKVRKTLEEQGKLNVKAVLVDKDGRWKAKPMAAPSRGKRKAVYDEDSEDEDEEMWDPGRKRQVKSASVIIDLSDDD